MVPLPRPASPRALWRDVKSFAAGRRRHHWIAMGLALVIPGIIITLFAFDVADRTEPQASVTYVESWPANRSLEESRATIEQRAAEQEKAAEARRKEYQAVKEQYGF